MKNKLITSLKYIFFLGIGVFLVWWSMHQIPDDKWGEFKLALANARYWLLIPVFMILTLSHLLRALRWKQLIEPLGYKISAPNAFFAVMIGYLANTAIPRLGEVLKCTLIAKYEKVPAEQVVGTIVAERAFDVVCLGLVFLLALIVQFDVVMASYDHIKDFVKPNPQSNNNIKIIVLCSLLFVGMVVLIWATLTKRLNMIVQKIKTLIIGVWEGLISARKVKNKPLFIFYSLAIWTLYALGTWIGFYGTLGTSGAGPAQAISCLAFASIGMIITPGGIGAYAFLLAKVLEFNGIPNEQGLANGTLQWFAQCIIVLVLGFISLILLPMYNKKKESGNMMNVGNVEV